MLGGVAVAGGGVVSWPVASKIVSTCTESEYKFSETWISESRLN